MFRYLALVWNPAVRSQCEAAQLLAYRVRATFGTWRMALEGEGLQVFCSTGAERGWEATPLPEDAGVLLGTVFERTSSDASLTARKEYRRARLTPQASARILASGGRALVSDYWGRYVAFLQERATGKRWVLRDPLGGLPCLSTSFRGVTLYCASIDDAYRLGVHTFTINWEYIAAAVAVEALSTHATALNEVSELYPGECVEVDGEQCTTRLYWEPSTFVASEPLEDFEQAVTAVRRTTRACINAWAACHEHLLLKLSGGLDSAIVLACLQHAPSRPAITCLNYYSRSFEGDERNFARRAAEAAGRVLLERDWNGNVGLEGIVNVVRSAQPISYWGWLQHGQRETELAASVGATALTGGEGGDQVFYQDHTELTAADYLYSHGLDAHFYKVLWDAARVSRQSIWRVLRIAGSYGWGGRYGWLGRRFPLETAATHVDSIIQLAVKQRAQRAATATHPWLARAGAMPPGKLWHSYTLSVPLVTHNPFDLSDPLDRFEPLTLSQPLIELCLRIPTYVLTMDGCERFLARQAFGAAIPLEIFNRYTKGGPRDGIKQLITQNREFIRTLLSDGLLVQRGVIDRERLRDALSPQPTRIKSIGIEILKLLSTEAWLRRWSDQRQRAAA